MSQQSKLIIAHKKLVYQLGKKKPEDIQDYEFATLDKQGMMLALLVNNVTCQGKDCEENEELQIHHIIERKHRAYMKLIIFIIQSRYFANLMLLCPKHHAILERKPPEGNGGACIAQKNIANAKSILEIDKENKKKYEELKKKKEKK